jgi:hypothetical protein
VAVPTFTPAYPIFIEVNSKFPLGGTAAIEALVLICSSVKGVYPVGTVSFG